MKIENDWGKTNLEKYLHYEYWEPYKALYILVGYLMLDSESPDDFRGVTNKEESDYQRLKDIWITKYIKVGLRHLYDDPHSPAYYIEWAISKNSRPAWLDWAIERGLYTTKQEAEKLAHDAKVKADPGTNPSGEGWEAQARTIADECFDLDTKMKCRDSLKGYSGRVMGIMQERGIKGARGIITNPATIMREALQGKKWWANKSK